MHISIAWIGREENTGFPYTTYKEMLKLLPGNVKESVQEVVPYTVPFLTGNSDFLPVENINIAPSMRT